MQEITGRTEPKYYQHVAVGCWFTSTGKMFPKMLKYEDEDGMVHTITNIKVTYAKQPEITGKLVRYFTCCAADHGVIKEFSLIFHPTENLWDLTFGNNWVY